jgi:hypothetical protein
MLGVMFDLPQPFGPTTPTRLLGIWIVVGSTNDLNPASLIFFNLILILDYCFIYMKLICLLAQLTA